MVGPVEKGRFIADIASSTALNQNTIRPHLEIQTEETRKDQLSVSETKGLIEKAITDTNEQLKAAGNGNTYLKFEYHEQLNKYFVKVVSEDTDEIVREVPPKKMLDMFAAMAESLGLIVDKKA